VTESHCLIEATVISLNWFKVLTIKLFFMWFYVSYTVLSKRASWLQWLIYCKTAVFGSSDCQLYFWKAKWLRTCVQDSSNDGFYSKIKGKGLPHLPVMLNLIF